MTKNETIKAHVYPKLKNTLKMLAEKNNVSESKMATHLISIGLKHFTNKDNKNNNANGIIFEHQKEVQIQILAAINTLTKLMTENQNGIELLKKRSSIHFSEVESASKLINGIEKKLKAG